MKYNIKEFTDKDYKFYGNILMWLFFSLLFIRIIDNLVELSLGGFIIGFFQTAFLAFTFSETRNMYSSNPSKIQPLGMYLLPIVLLAFLMLARIPANIIEGNGLLLMLQLPLFVLTTYIPF